MAVPKKKLSRSRSRKRSSTKTYKNLSLVACSNCKQMKKPHLVCPSCGYYNGRQVFKPKEAVKITKVKSDEG